MNNTQARVLAEALAECRRLEKDLRHSLAQEASDKVLFRRLTAARLYVRERQRVDTIVAMHIPLAESVAAATGIPDDTER